MDAEIRKQDKSHFSAAGFTPTAALSLFSLVKKKERKEKRKKRETHFSFLVSFFPLSIPQLFVFCHLLTRSPFIVTYQTLQLLRYLCNTPAGTHTL